MEPANLRQSVIDATRASVVGCFVELPAGDKISPLVACARHKALAVDAELEALAANEEAAILMLDAQYDAVLIAGRLSDLVSCTYAARIAEVRTAAAVKRVSLQTDAVAADSALDGALGIFDALTEVRSVAITLACPPSDTSTCLSGRQNAK